MEVKKITYLGAYGLIFKGGKLLLTEKTKGPYTGLWDLPGGGIEFGESPEEALTREIKEEVALAASELELITVMTYCCDLLRHGIEHQFHHIGVIFRVNSVSDLSDVIPEENLRWVAVAEVIPDELSPFAKACLPHLA